YDLHFLVRGRQATSNIVLLAEDQKAMDTFPELRPFWHKHYADAIRAAAGAGAKAIGIDHAFGIPVERWYPDYDRLLAAAVIEAQPIPVVVTYVPELNTNPEAQKIRINMMAASLGFAAFPNLTADPDDFVRNQTLIEKPQTGDRQPQHSFALRLAEASLGAHAQFENGKLSIQGLSIPISAQRTVAINYAGPPGAFPSVSLADFEVAAQAGNQEQLRKWVEGKIVLIGTDFVDDRFPTPFYTPL